MTSDTERIRQVSGNVTNGDPLVGFLYLLMRSHLPAGVVADVILEVEHLRPEYHEALYSNGWLARYAEDCAARLRPQLPTEPGETSAGPTYETTILRPATRTEVVIPFRGKRAA